MIRRAGLLAGIAFAISACAAPSAPDAPAEPEAAVVEAPEGAGSDVKPEMDGLDRVEDTCGLNAFKPFLGKTAADIPPELLPDTARIVGPDTNVTMDYVPTRVNILTNEDGTIIGMKCG